MKRRISAGVPKGQGNYGNFQRDEKALEKAKEAQKLLIELGPVLVEMGLLDP